MKIAQRKLKWIARLVLALTLFTQGVLAVHACVSANASAAHAVLMQSQDTMDDMPCCPHHADTPAANECLMHCTQSDQVSLDQHAPAAMPVSDAALQVAMPPLERRIAVQASAPLALDTGPPLPILYCSFLL